MRHVSMVLKACLFTLAVLGISNAHADGGSSLTSFQQNLAHGRLTMPFNLNNVEASPTLVKGIYVLQDRGTDHFRAFINEAGTIFGTAAGWTRIAPNGDLTAVELAQLRTELLANIASDQLIKVQYGDGGGRRMILFSAVDCVHCQRFEQSARKMAASLNTTFYVLPLSLQPMATPQGQVNWQTAATIWCSPQNDAAWLAYWKEPDPIANQSCGLTGRQTARAFDYLRGLLGSVGIRVQGTPEVVREDGKVMVLPDNLNKTFVQDNLSRGALVAMHLQPPDTPLHWLAEREPAPTDTNENNPSNRKINLGNALKGLFSR